MLKPLLAGAVLALMGVSSAEAGHRWFHRGYDYNCGQPARVWYGPSVQGGTYYAPPAAPSAAPLTQTVPAPASSSQAVQPPVASGPGQTIRRFSEEPGVEAAPYEAAPRVAAPAQAPASSTPPAYRPAPSYRSQTPSAAPARNPVERRLRPGGGWRR